MKQLEAALHINGSMVEVISGNHISLILQKIYGDEKSAAYL